MRLYYFGTLEEFAGYGLGAREKALGVFNLVK